MHTSQPFKPMITRVTIPASTTSQRGVDKSPHFLFVAGKQYQRNNGKTELQRQNHLAENQQLADAMFAVPVRHDDGRHDRHRAGQQSPHPGAQAKMQETFHHDLTGHRAGERRVLARGQQGQGKDDAGPMIVEHPTEQLVGLGNIGHRFMLGAVKRGGGNDQNRGIDEKGEQQRGGRVDRGVANRHRFAGVVPLERPGLHDARVQIEIMRHDGRAQDADRQIKHRGILNDLRRRNQPRQQLADRGMGRGDLVGKASADQ